MASENPKTQEIPAEMRRPGAKDKTETGIKNSSFTLFFFLTFSYKTRLPGNVLSVGDMKTAMLSNTIQ